MNTRLCLIGLLTWGCNDPRLVAVGGGADAAIASDDAGGDASTVGSLVIQPPAITVPAGRNQIFVADMTAPTWSVMEPGGGTIDANGMYRAPEVPGIYHVVATNGTSTGTATVIVQQMNLEVLTGGFGGSGNVDGLGAAARFVQLADVVSDGAGTLYVADYDAVRALDVTTNRVTTLAGGGTGPERDGIGANARFDRVWSLALDAGTGTLYVSDQHSIRAIDLATRAVTTIAGAYRMAGTTDGPGLTARFKAIRGLCLAGTTLYIADSGASTIRALDTSAPTHDVQRIAGQVSVMGYADSPDPLTATFSAPMGLACTPSTIYVADKSNSAIRAIDRTTGNVTTLVGAPGRGFSNGPFATAGVIYPAYLALDPTRTKLYAADHAHGVIRMLDLGTQTATTLVGTPGTGGWQDGVGPHANLRQAAGMVADGHTLWFADFGNYNVRRIDLASRAVATIAGTFWQTTAGSIDGPLEQATFSGPSRLTSDGEGNVYVAGDYAIRKISFATGTVTLHAGRPGVLGLVDGGPLDARLGSSFGLYVDPAGTMWESGSSQAIRSIAADGTVTTHFGALGQHGNTDQPARFYAPSGMVVVGNQMIVADCANYALRAIDRTTGAVTTLAGATGMAGGDDGIGAAARFRGPWAIATDGVNKVWVGDWGSGKGSTIREVDVTTRQVTTIAGDYDVVDVDDGIGTAAHFTGIYAFAYDGHGSLYIADTGMDARSRGVAMIRRMWVPTRAVSTYAGQVGIWGASPGPLQTASLAYPYGLAFTPSGELLVTGENAIFTIAAE